ncbi:aminotransferase class I/II-fold pyridoxal phosphate-dependent enzyme [Rummeliibacillus sp. TYF005]|uniref:aminotransferase class I/II-fold pyridoxal phosphate-dependent enzyme n=1 Tax=Rummeliibacillus sp. TYF005 TaxID=2058214 RepID=UPI000F5364CE|nr:aminotransferase class I/II-fold pyridoxal phosphate-dependent enzyme [Rummeliibacillus sp. TYF005]RPJ96502.1 aminotransferase class I/II-fold pyridoxal phosphate-dependent enzyme [Rummeliibacillus sp. TYF005]
MSLSMNPKMDQLGLPGIRKFSNQLVNYPDAINLTIGQPDFPTPASVKQAGIRAIENNLTTYSANPGLIELRKAVAAFFAEKYNCHYKPEDEILVTNGATQAIDSVFRTILAPGDEIILPAPIYSGYEPVITYCGAKVVYLDTTDTDFQPSAERLAKLITPKTKAVLFNFPSNPTGATISHEQMDALANVLKDEDLYIISDEIYSENTFVGEHRSFGSYAELKDRLFLIHGLSKSHSMTGWRIGFLMADARLIAEVAKIHSFNAICAALPSQYAAIEALTNCKDTPQEMNISYIKRRDYVYDRLVKMGIEVNKPNGAFYIFPSIKKFGLTSEQFAIRLMQRKEGGVGVIPGSVFTPYGEGYLRITYAYSDEELKEGMDRLEAFVHSL